MGATERRALPIDMRDRMDAVRVLLTRRLLIACGVNDTVSVETKLCLTAALPTSYESSALPLS
jgi:hypothetical protein